MFVEREKGWVARYVRPGVLSSRERSSKVPRSRVSGRDVGRPLTKVHNISQCTLGSGGGVRGDLPGGVPLGG